MADAPPQNFKTCTVSITMKVRQMQEGQPRSVDADFDTERKLTGIDGAMYPAELKAFHLLVHHATAIAKEFTNTAVRQRKADEAAAKAAFLG